MALYLDSKLAVLVSSTVILFTLILGNVAQAQTIQVYVDEAKILRLDEPVAKIIVGNPSMADVSVQSNTMMVLTGKSYGKTNMILLNADGDTIFNANISVNQAKDRTVAVHKGIKRYSYHCGNSFCNGTAEMGDDPEHFAEVSASATGKLSLAQTLSGQGGGKK